MANEIFTSGLNFYQSANADSDTIKDDFIVRLHEYNIIMDDIRNNPMKGSVQHYLLIGRRGSGKSTLLKRLQIEIEQDENLAAKFIPINLAEEQANIYKLYDLWEGVLYELQYTGIDVREPIFGGDEQVYTREIFEAIHKAIEVAGKKIILLLDNIDRVLENVGYDAGLFRETLLNYDDIKIIGGSTRMTEHFWKYNQPFYQFFRVLELKPLSIVEIKTLMLHWAKKLNLPILQHFIDHKHGQLEAVRILTDGLPRTLQFFVNILINRQQETGYQYIKLIMDQVTPLYQERLNSLPPAQRKIVLQMAFIWEAAGANRISLEARMSNSVVSAQLKQLSEKGVVEKIETSTKNHLYRLSERFFNLWLIFTQGSPHEKRRAKYLTIFLENFYNEQELIALVKDHIKCLEGKTLHPDKAVILTKAFAQLKNISFRDRDLLITKTKLLDNIAKDALLQLPRTIPELFNDIENCIVNSRWDECYKLIDGIEQEDGIKDSFFGVYYLYKKDLVNAEKYYENAYKKGFVNIVATLAGIYEANNKLDLAEEYYKKAIELGSENAHLEIADFYKKQNNDKLALYYYRLAVKLKNNNAFLDIAMFYEEKKKIRLAEKYYQKAIDNKVEGALYNLAHMYDEAQRYDEAEEFYKKAIEYDPTDNMAKGNLALLYYVFNINKGEALSLINNINNDDNEGKSHMLKIIIQIWNGQKVDIQREVKAILSKYSLISTFIFDLLVHYQERAVYNLLTDAEYGEGLVDKYLPLYYASKLFIERRSTDLKIPPELSGVVNDIITSIEDKRKFYYSPKSKD